MAFFLQLLYVALHSPKTELLGIIGAITCKHPSATTSCILAHHHILQNSQCLSSCPYIAITIFQQCTHSKLQ